MGIIICAYGSSTVLFAPLADRWLPDTSLGLSRTFQLLSLIFFSVVTVFGVFMATPSNDNQADDPTYEESLQKQYPPMQVLKSKDYYRALCILLFLIPLYYLISPFIKVTSAARGLTQAQAITLIMLSGIISVIGRFICPKLTDLINTKKVINLLYLLVLVCSIFIGFARGELYFIAVLAINFIYGGSMGILPVIASDYFGTKYLSSNLGLFMIIVMIMSFLSPIIVYGIEMLGNRFIYLGIATFVLGIIGIVLNNFNKRSA